MKLSSHLVFPRIKYTLTWTGLFFSYPGVVLGYLIGQTAGVWFSLAPDTINDLSFGLSLLSALMSIIVFLFYGIVLAFQHLNVSMPLPEEYFILAMQLIVLAVLSSIITAIDLWPVIDQSISVFYSWQYPPVANAGQYVFFVPFVFLCQWIIQLFFLNDAHTSKS